MEFSVKADEVTGQFSSSQISILLIAEVALVRLALRQLLSRVSEAVIVGEGGFSQALALAHHLRPDIALIDANSVDGALMGFLERLAAAAEKTRAILLSDNDFGSGVIAAAEAGAWGYVPRDVSEAELVRAVRMVAQGYAVMGCWLAPDQFIGLKELAPHRAEIPLPLSQKESSVIKAMAQGQTDIRIAQELGISVPTVKTHVRSILRKTSARNRAGAIATAFRNGILK